MVYRWQSFWSHWKMKCKREERRVDRSSQPMFNRVDTIWRRSSDTVVEGVILGERFRFWRNSQASCPNRRMDCLSDLPFAVSRFCRRCKFFNDLNIFAAAFRNVINPPIKPNNVIPAIVYRKVVSFDYQLINHFLDGWSRSMSIRWGGIKSWRH